MSQADENLEGRVQVLERELDSLRETVVGMEKRTPKKKPTKKGDVAELWSAYACEFSQHFKGTPPSSSARTNGQLSNLLKRLGKEDAIATIRFYFTQRDSEFIRDYFGTNMLLMRAEALNTRRKTGIKHSQQSMKRDQARSAAQSHMDDKYAKADK